jgi:HK97 family phage portal protein
MSEGSPTIWGRLAAPFRRAFGASIRPDDPRRYQQWVQLLDQPAGVTITPDNALEISAVWACVMAISNALAPAQWKILTTTPEGRKEALPDDPLAYLLNVRPNSDMTSISLRYALLMARLTWGNGYAAITKSASGKITELWPMLPHRTIPTRDRETGALYYEYHQLEGGIVRLEQDEVFHVKGPGISGLLGENVVARAAKSMSLAAAAERFASTYFGNNTIVGGVLSAPFKFPRDADGKSAVAERLRDDWAAMHQGPNKAWRPAILENGMKWEPFTTNATDAQLVEARRHQIEEIARWYGVPGHLIGVAGSSQGYGTNLEELSLSFNRHTLTPLCREMEQEADYKLLAQRAPWRHTLIDLKPLTHGDAVSRANSYKLHRDMGVLTVNEIREAEGWNHIGADGDVRVVPLGYQTFEQLVAPQPKLMAATGPQIAQMMAILQSVVDGHLPADSAHALMVVSFPGLAEEQIAAMLDGLEEFEAEPIPAPPMQLPPPPPADVEDAEIVGEDPGADGVAVSAVARLFGVAFERYVRRLSNREADLRRGGADEERVSAALTEERERLRGSWLTDETRDARELAAELGATLTTARLVAALTAIDGGEAPREAAARLVRDVVQRAPAKATATKKSTSKLVTFIRDADGQVVGATLLEG